MSDAPARTARYPGPDLGPENDFTPVPTDLLEGGIANAIERQVAAGPERLALKDGERTWTYGAMNRAVNRLARAVRAAAPDPAHPVVLMLPHGAEAVLGVLAAFKAGKPYVAIDASFPPERAGRLIDDSQADLLLTTEEAAVVRPGLTVLDVEAAGQGLPDDDLRLPSDLDAPAGIFYTSGSTGRPKGVVQTQRAVLHSKISIANVYHLCDSDRVAQTVSFGMSASVNYTLCPLLAGASVHCFDVRRRGLGALARWVRRERITFLYSVPTVFRKLMASAGDEGFPSVRVLGLGGETILRHDVELFRRHFPAHCWLRLALGMSEVPGGVARMFINPATPLPDGPVPAGYPPKDVELLLLDEERRPVPEGEAGEVAVRGRYLARGYWRRPELTAQKFLPDPDGGDRRIYLSGDLAWRTPEGCYVHAGRKDSMVKVRGQRVETAEVEAALLALGGLAGVAVVTRPDADGANRLVACVVPDGTGPVPTVGELWDAARRVLPPALVPSEFVIMDALPLTDVGKVDRAALVRVGQEEGERP